MQKDSILIFFVDNECTCVDLNNKQKNPITYNLNQ